MRNRNTIEYLGIWEQLYNPDFKPTEFEGFRMQAGLNAFTLSPKKWIEATGAIGIVAKSGRYGGTYGVSRKSIIDKVMSDCKCNAIDDVPQKYTVKYPFRHRTTQVKPLYCHKHHYDERH